jgi:hypothetical protein
LPPGSVNQERAHDRCVARGRQQAEVFDSWVTGAEATLKASFELQNASLAAGLAVLDAASASQRSVYQEWDGSARRAQTAALDAFHAHRNYH